MEVKTSDGQVPFELSNNGNSWEQLAYRKHLGCIWIHHSKALSQWERRDWEVIGSCPPFPCSEVPHVIYEERIIEVPQAGWVDDDASPKRPGVLAHWHHGSE